jgi:hypothetical protein
MSIGTQATDWTRSSDIGRLMARMHADASQPPCTFAGLPNHALEVQSAFGRASRLLDMADTQAALRRAGVGTDPFSRMHELMAQMRSATTLLAATESTLTALNNLSVDYPARVTRRGV